MAVSTRLWHATAVATAFALTLSPGLATAGPEDKDLGSYGQPPGRSGSYQHISSSKWFVEFDGQPTADGGSRATVDKAHRGFADNLRKSGKKARVQRSFTTLFNGVTVDADSETAQALTELPGVKAIYPVFPVQVPRGQTSTPDITHAIELTGADIAQSKLRLSGRGVKVGIIDSGIDYDHPDLGGSGKNGKTKFPTKRVRYGYDFVGDAYNADPTSPAFNPVPKPDKYPDDCQGHGTHVAGIVGANGTIKGVAPKVTFGAYRVFGCDGSTDTDIILTALERAKRDGMDVVNMSLGAGFQSWPSYPTSVASDRLWRHGIVVVNSAGNEGDYFTQSLGSPASSDKAIAVASFDNSQVRLSEMTFAPVYGTPISAGYQPATGSPAATTAIRGLPVTGLTDPLGCEAGGDATGAVAIVSRGTCAFHIKAVNAQNAGASALVIYNNAPGFVSATVEGETPITIPVVTVSQEDGQAVVAALSSGPLTATVTGNGIDRPNPSAGLVSDFSSWGLAADLTLKPDLGAPGGSIYSLEPVEMGNGYVVNSGTSMAAPHVAGAVALMLQARPSMRPNEVLTRLQNTAMPANLRELPDLGILDATHRQGAGLIQIDQAILSTTLVTPAKLSAGESADGRFRKTLTIRNTSKRTVTWTLSKEDAVSTEPGAWQNEFLPALYDTRVAFSRNKVRVPARGTARVTVSIAPDRAAPEGTVYSGYVVLTSNEGTTLSVPFAGMAGDYGNLDVFPDLGIGVPALVEVTCGKWFEGECVDPDVTVQEPDPSKVFHGGEDPATIVTHVAYPVRRLTFHLIPVTPAGKLDERRGREVMRLDYVGRSPELSLFSWDGKVPGKKGARVDAPAGTYALRMTALKADGDRNTQAWTTPAFRFDPRPDAGRPSNKDRIGTTAEQPGR
ncbi:MAG: S8 family serine peptidase [Tessaracoccus sp.]|uniref:S8 family serine peptidase n=1 Tax=Tessaracoccus sp. TaxID=1971211 RepID=UPI001EC33E6B|nr:S8 family serine peptidase [Tessaracoccus sp.]MBK7820014.1 S8 family serine peptidase [Tessaracoccus sp.]